MEKLDLLTKKVIIDLSSITSDKGDGIREYNLKSGYAIAKAIKSSDSIAVVDSFLSSGTVFPYHEHQTSDEVLVVYDGICTVVLEDGKKVELNPGNSLHVCMGCGHMLIAKTDVHIIAITIPPDKVAMPTRLNG